MATHDLPHLNRRAVLAGAATVAATALPAIAAAGDDAELLAIGEKMKALWPSYEKARGVAHEEYERWWELAGMKDREALDQMSFEERHRRLDEAKPKTNYSAAYAEMNGLANELHPLSEAAMRIEPSTMAGFGVLAAAALFTDGPGFGSTPHSEVVLTRMARAAGFEIEIAELAEPGEPDDDDGEEELS